MPDHKSLNEMLVSSMLKLQLLRKGYKVAEQEHIDGKRYDLVFTKKDLQSAPVIVIDMKQYSGSSLKRVPKHLVAQTFRGTPIEHHTVFIKGNGREVMTDKKLAELLSSEKELEIISY